MNSPTTRRPSPAAAPRTGRDRPALPGDPSLDALLADPDLGSTAKIIAAALVKHWAWSKDHCWPGDASIAKKIGKSPGHVQRCLRQLERAGYIRREHTPELPSGRRIWLLWRRPELGAGAQPPPAPARTGGPAPARSEPVVVEQGGAEPGGVRHAPQRPRPPATATPSPTVAIPDQAAETTGRVAPLDPPPAPTPQRIAPPAPPPVAPPQGPASAPRPRITDQPMGARVSVPSSQEAKEPARARTAPCASPPAALPAHQGAPVVLTASEQARLRELPELAREQVQRWLCTGDAILVAEARCKLAPPRPRPEVPKSLPELLGRIREDPSFPSLAAAGLATALRDQGSYTGYLRRCEEAWRGELEPGRLLSAYEQALGPKARNRGAIFMVAVKHRE